MDIRQWVLLTDVNPLTVWMFRSAYVRFSSTPFTLDTLDDRWRACVEPGNVHVVCFAYTWALCGNGCGRFVHLCNRSVQETLDPEERGSAAATDADLASNMWSTEQFRRHLMCAQLLVLLVS